MTMAPSVSYSITARLEVSSHGRAVSEITRAVEQAGGVVTAIDVNSGNRGALRVDVTCAATDTAHAESLVAAMAAIPGVTVHNTDAWEAARRGFARLLGRGDPDRTRLAERRLAETHEQLTGAVVADLEVARTTLEAQWGTRLADLLEEDPGVEAELRALVEELRAALPAGAVSATDHAVAAGRDVNISADRGGFAAGVVHGNIAPPNPGGPGRATI